MWTTATEKDLYIKGIVKEQLCRTSASPEEYLAEMDPRTRTKLTPIDIDPTGGSPSTNSLDCDIFAPLRLCHGEHDTLIMFVVRHNGGNVYLHATDLCHRQATWDTFD